MTEMTILKKISPPSRTYFRYPSAFHPRGLHLVSSNDPFPVRRSAYCCGPDRTSPRVDDRDSAERLERIGLAVHLRTSWWRWMHGAQLDRLVHARLHREERESRSGSGRGSGTSYEKPFGTGVRIQHVRIGWRNFFQSSSLADTHMKTATKRNDAIHCTHAERNGRVNSEL